MREGLDGARQAVVAHEKIFRAQAGHRMAAMNHERVHGDEGGGGAEQGRFRRRLRRGQGGSDDG